MIFGIILILELLVLGIVFRKQISVQMAHFIAFCRTLGLWAAVLIMAVSAVLPVIMMPVFPIMSLSGPLFTEIYDNNPWKGGSVAFACVFTGLWHGSVIAFALGKSCFKTYAAQVGRENTYLYRLNKIIDRGGIKIVFMARCLPVLPGEIFDYAVAATSLQTWQYAVGCFGSAVPVAFWCISTAHAAAAAAEKDGAVQSSRGMKWLFVALNVVAVIVLTVVIVCAIKDEEQSPTHLAGTNVDANPDIQQTKRGIREIS